MIKKALVLVVFVAVSFIAACNSHKMNGITATAPVFPTATSYFLFVSDLTPGAPPDIPEASSSTPTIASVFDVYPSATPYPYETPTPRNTLLDTVFPVTEVIDSGTPTLIPQLYPMTIYDDSINPNWELGKSTGMEIYLASTDKVYQGQTAISFTPLKENAVLFFTVNGQSIQTYPRDKVSRLFFRLYSGEDALQLNQFSVAVVSSNTPTYWSADGQPVASFDQAAVAFETREVIPDLNGPIPPRTWAPVELDLTGIITKDQDIKYITGFYIKTDATIDRALAIDDINLEMINEGSEMLVATPQPAGAQAHKVVNVQIDPKKDIHPISKLIYGLSGAPSEVLQVLLPGLNSWGGNLSTRYNWEIGHAWNAGSDNFYRNGNYGITSGSASDDFVSQTLQMGADVRISLPALGWVAKDDDPNTCSFPVPGGGCGDAGGASCQDTGDIKIADPKIANVVSDVNTDKAWVTHLLKEKSFNIRFLAIDNEPELWGFTHYDVHPQCTTYAEILRKYLLYADYLHNYAPQAELVGPVTSGWYYYWNSAAGKEDKKLHDNVDFLPWFLQQLQAHDQKTSRRSLDVLDIHYFPQNVYNMQADEKTAALRLRSTRSLWDTTYVDESLIGEPVYLIPRMKALIAENYPGTKLGISEWNWGAEQTMNGALAIADVLGIFGREDLYYSAYWQYPPLNSPGFFAFKMYTNFDDRGGHFGDTSIMAVSDDVDTLGSYAALDSITGTMYVMLVNKQPTGDVLAQMKLDDFIPGKTAEVFRYDETHLEGIKTSNLILAGSDITLRLPAYSITLLIFHPQK